MISNEFYGHEVHGEYEHFALGDYELENGGKLRNCNIAYTTVGKLNAKKDNAILVLSRWQSPRAIRTATAFGETARRGMPWARYSSACCPREPLSMASRN